MSQNCFDLRHLLSKKACMECIVIELSKITDAYKIVLKLTNIFARLNYSRTLTSRIFHGHNYIHRQYGVGVTHYTLHGAPDSAGTTLSSAIGADFLSIFVLNIPKIFFNIAIEYEIIGEGSQILTNQKRESTVFSLLISRNLRPFPDNLVLYFFLRKFQSCTAL